MDEQDTKRHAFVIRIWLEREEENRQAWRGHITHVMSGKRQYLNDLESIQAFIKAYVKDMSTK